MVEYSNNGLLWVNVDPASSTTAGCIRFPAPAHPTDLAAAFPGYTAAVQVQELTAQIASLQAQIDALDGGAQSRSVRAMLLALGGGDPVSLARLQALEASIVPLRTQVATLQTQLAAAQAALTAAITPAAS
jgi:uncharacterized small protein (DUF1192 family)